MEDEEDEEGTSNNARAYLIGEGYYAKKQKEREKQEAEEQKQIEESVAEAKEERKEELLAKVLDVLVDSEWYARIKNFIRNAVANSDTQMVQMLLVREKDDIWSFEAIVSSEKPKGVQYLKVNFGNES